MKARDVMVAPVITVRPTSLVRDAARLLIQHRISAVPVVDDNGKVVGIVSEGDLMRRVETGTEHHKSWLLRVLAGEVIAASDYTKSHARKVGDVMTRDVVSAPADTPIRDIADIFEKRGIKRVPIVKDGQLVGIVSRANLIQALAAAPHDLEIPMTDTAIREKLLQHLRTQKWAHTSRLNVIVHAGLVDVWGMTDSEEERRAIRVAAENTPGVLAVQDHLNVALGPLF